MPGFAGALDDAQVAALADYMRARFAHAPPWRDVGRDAARIRAERKR
jgi:mono/diheme cytochrome c family protein